MPEALSAALAVPGLWWIAGAYLIAGVVRGFTGFGTALIVVPVAGIFLEPAAILLMIGVTGILSNILLVPGAWRVADRSEVAVLSLAAIPGTWLGLWLLSSVDGTIVRWVVTVLAGVTLLAVITGWQWRGRLERGGLACIGGAAGTVGGMTALTGPIALIFYLANARKAESVRANMILFLGALDVMLVFNIVATGLATWTLVCVGLIVSVPYLSTIAVGQALFDPSRERLYRALAYTIVAIAVLTGSPIWES